MIVLDRWSLMKLAIDNVTLPGDFAEFGVYQGKSARYILKLMEKREHLFWLFDSFYGLPADWEDGGIFKGHFTVDGVPPVFDDPRVRVVKGMFHETLSTWEKRPLAFVNIDCDIYSSTVTILKAIEEDCLRVGTVIHFDDLYGYDDWENRGEMLAWRESVERTGFTYEWLGRSDKWRIVIKLTGRK